MAIILLDPALIITRVDGQVSTLKIVAGAADFVAAVRELKQTPSAWVIPASDRATRSSTGTEVVSQNNETTFGVVIAAQNLRDVRGEQAQADMRTLRISVMTALLGWSPASGFQPCEFAGGRLLELGDTVLWWQDNYITGALIRS